MEGSQSVYTWWDESRWQ